MRLVIGASRGKSPETLAGEIVDLGWSEFGHTPSTHLVVDFRSIPAVTCCCVLFENPALQQRILPSRRTPSYVLLSAVSLRLSARTSANPRSTRTRHRTGCPAGKPPPA